MVWKQNAKTGQFEFNYAEISERKDGDIICNDCGDAVPQEDLDLFDLQDVEVSRVITEQPLAAHKTLTNCESCNSSFAETGVFQLWDVDWKWNETKQRFELDQAYPSELNDYEIRCNHCGDCVSEGLDLESIKVMGAN